MQCAGGRGVPSPPAVVLEELRPLRAQRSKDHRGVCGHVELGEPLSRGLYDIILCHKCGMHCPESSAWVNVCVSNFDGIFR